MPQSNALNAQRQEQKRFNFVADVWSDGRTHNAKSGLINTPLLINLLLHFFCNLKTGGPPGLINRLART